MKILCPNCKGKKYVFNPECLGLTIMFWLPMLLESNQQEEGLSKRKCGTCEGRGIVEYK